MVWIKVLEETLQMAWDSMKEYTQGVEEKQEKNREKKKLELLCFTYFWTYSSFSSFFDYLCNFPKGHMNYIHWKVSFSSKHSQSFARFYIAMRFERRKKALDPKNHYFYLPPFLLPFCQFFYPPSEHNLCSLLDIHSFKLK